MLDFQIVYLYSCVSVMHSYEHMTFRFIGADSEIILSKFDAFTAHRRFARAYLNLYS